MQFSKFVEAGISVVSLGMVLTCIGCSSRDGNYDPGTIYPAGFKPIPADGTPPYPQTAQSAAAAEPLPPLTPEEIGPTVDYTVKTGDSLWLIARNHKTTVSKLKRINQLDSDVILAGQVIKVPGGSPQAAPAPSAAPKAAPAPQAAPSPSPAPGFNPPASTGSPKPPAASASPGSGLKIQD